MDNCFFSGSRLFHVALISCRVMFFCGVLYIMYDYGPSGVYVYWRNDWYNTMDDVKSIAT